MLSSSEEEDGFTSSLEPEEAKLKKHTKGKRASKETVEIEAQLATHNEELGQKEIELKTKQKER